MPQAPLIDGRERLGPVPRAMLAAALIATLALAGCGRKGGLDAPPMAAAGDVQSPPPGATAAPGSDSQSAQPGQAPQSQPVAKQRTFLDWLIN